MIAEKRQLSYTTIENHLAHFVSTGEIPISRFVPQDLSDLISAQLEKDEELKLGPVKELLGEKVSWGDIRFVKSHLMFLRRSGQHVD